MGYMSTQSTSKYNPVCCVYWHLAGHLDLNANSHTAHKQYMTVDLIFLGNVTARHVLLTVYLHYVYLCYICICCWKL